MEKKPEEEYLYAISLESPTKNYLYQIRSNNLDDAWFKAVDYAFIASEKKYEKSAIKVVCWVKTLLK